MGKRDLPDIPYLSEKGGNSSLEVKISGDLIEATMTAKPGPSVKHGHKIAVKLYQKEKFIDITWSVDNKNAVPEPEGGWMSLPLKIDNPSYHLARLGGFIDPTKDIVKNTYKDLFCLNGGMSVYNEKGHAVIVTPLDSPLVSIGETGLWKVSKEFSPKKPTVFVNLYNNMWGTNFQQWIGGSWSSTVRICSVDNYNPNTDLMATGHEDRSPLNAAFSAKKNGNLPKIERGIEISPKRSLIITSMKKMEKGGKMLINFWNQTDKSSPATVIFPKKLKVTKAIPCDLRGTVIGKPIKLKENKLKIKVKAFAPYSFILK